MPAKPSCSVADCTNPRLARGLCGFHYGRARNGIPFDRPRKLTGHPEARFWAKVAKSDGCWIWVGCTNDDGYGHFALNPRRNIGAHRYSYELANGPIPAGQHVLHRCDTPACVRPDHLELGGHVDNMRQMVERGRSTRGRVLQSKISSEVANEIRTAYAAGEGTQLQLAHRFGISRSQVGNIVRGEQWAAA